MVTSPLRRKQQSVTGGARRQNAIHHVHAHGDVVHNFLRRAHAHQIARLVLGQEADRGVDHLVGHGSRLADAQAADGVSREIQLDRALRRFAAQVWKHSTLNDAKQRLRLTAPRAWPAS